MFIHGDDRIMEQFIESRVTSYQFGRLYSISEIHQPSHSLNCIDHDIGLQYR